MKRDPFPESGEGEIETPGSRPGATAVRGQTGTSELLKRSVAKSADEEESTRAIVKAVLHEEGERGGGSEESHGL